MTLRLTITILTAAVALTGCAAQSGRVTRPTWVSKSINGLQLSTCHCGGVETEKHFKARKEAEARAQAEGSSAQFKEGGQN